MTTTVGTPSSAAAPPHVRSVQRRRMPIALAVVVVALLGQMAVQLVIGLHGDTATYDEPVNVRSGVVYALEDDLGPNPEHPPFTKLLSGWAVTAFRPDPTADLESFEVIRFPRAPEYGERVLATRAAAQDVVQAGRVPMVVLTLLLGLVVFLFARDLFGQVGAVVALAAYAFAPELIGHGYLATNDLPAAGFVVAALWASLRLSRSSVHRPAVRRACLAAVGTALGLGLATKYQVLLYVPAVVAAVGAAAWWSGRREGLPPSERWLRVLGWIPAVVGISVACVWLVSLVVDWQGTFDPPPTGFGERASGFWAGVVDRLPFPEAYRAGLRYQLEYSKVPKHAFLLGDTYWGHRFWYQPLVLTMKYPVVTVGLWVAGVVAVVRRRHAAAAMFALLPAALVLAVGMAWAADIGGRYVIATPVLLSVVAGAAFAGLRWPRTLGVGQPRRLGVAAAAVVVLALSSALAAPHHLAFVNQAWGGTDRAYERVANSAVDWGQDLGRLGGWIDDHAAGRQVYLSYFGTTDPLSVGVDAVPITADQAMLMTDGVVAVSVTDYNRYRSAFAGLGPVRDSVGGSILIFEPGRLDDREAGHASPSPSPSTTSHRSRQSAQR